MTICWWVFVSLHLQDTNHPTNQVRSVLVPHAAANCQLDNWYWLLLFLIVLVLLFYLWRRKPAIVQQWSQTISSAVTQRLQPEPGAGEAGHAARATHG